MNDNIIHILPDFIANQIAAGEVVQKPESVVKELVENSLDAGADNITVIVKQAGKQLIHIVDNGGGMSGDDLALSIKRHATSKISKTEDLDRIMTFGFRGEALASISAVAQLEIITRRKIDQLGWRLVSEPLKEPVIEQYNTTVGTQILVKNLFYNVPARRKFLRSNITEFRYISDTMLKFAIGNPDKRFTFYDNDNLIFNTKPESQEKRIAEVLGRSVDELIKISHSNDLIKVDGYVCKPHLAKTTRSGQFLYLNGRSIQSRSLGYAVYSSMEHLLEKNSQPFFVIMLEIDPEKVDINVHPQKHEVKFDDERFVFNSIFKAVNQALQATDLIPSSTFDEQAARSPFQVITPAEPDSKPILVNRMTGEIMDMKPTQQSYSQSYSNKGGYEGGFRRDNFDSNRQLSGEGFQSAFDSLFSAVKNEKSTEEDNLPTISGKEDNQSDKYYQVHNKYIITQSEKGFIIVDQHAAHERILYEKAIRAMNRDFSYSQELLFPVVSKLDAGRMSLVRELETELKDIGFNLTFRSEAEIEISTVPLDIQPGAEANALTEIISDYLDNFRLRQTDKRDSLAASYSCKAAIKTGASLSQAEMHSLIIRLFNCDMPYVCPHGRPTLLEYPLEEFDKEFKRT
ncbi:MAG: mismatch repair protein MutL [Bacteroidota bacterium]|nr:mismatch repair protein MutL [Bacteroidota bacterium]